MATPTLDEIEARARLLEPGCGVQGTAFLSDLLLALVTHVRALAQTTMVVDQRQRGAAQRLDMAADRITALEEKVAALESKAPCACPKCMAGAGGPRALSYVGNGPDGVPRYEPMATAFEKQVELDRLRAENAAQSKALEEALLLGKDALFAAQAREQKLAEENAELRKNAKCQLPHCDCLTWARTDWKAGSNVPVGHHPRCVLPYAPAPDPQWPAPQPIETAPLGRILVVFEAGQMEVIRPVKVDTESSWREFLKMNKATHWWPIPPPPGGGKDQQPPKQKPARTCNIHIDCGAAVRHAHAKGFEPEPCCNKKCDPDCDGHNCAWETPPGGGK